MNIRANHRVSFRDDIANHGADAALVLGTMRTFIALESAHSELALSACSVELLAEYHPYFNAKKIARILSKLEADGVLVSNTGRDPFDRAKRYTII